MKQSAYIIDKLPESILKFLDSDRGTIFYSSATDYCRSSGCQK